MHERPHRPTRDTWRLGSTDNGVLMPDSLEEASEQLLHYLGLVDHDHMIRASTSSIRASGSC